MILLITRIFSSQCKLGPCLCWYDFQQQVMHSSVFLILCCIVCQNPLGLSEHRIGSEHSTVDSLPAVWHESGIGDKRGTWRVVSVVSRTVFGSMLDFSQASIGLKKPLSQSRSPRSVSTGRSVSHPLPLMFVCVVLMQILGRQQLAVQMTRNMDMRSDLWHNWIDGRA